MPPRLGRTSRRTRTPDPFHGRDLESLPVVAVDLETTGGSPVRSRIVEVAAVRFEGYREVACLDDLIDPLVPIPPEVTAIHGITDGMVRGRPRIDEVLPDLWQFFGGAVLLAHHAPFDCGFLAYELSKRPSASPSNPIMDSCKLSRRVFPEHRSHSLSSLCEQFGIRREREHRAADDARACYEVFRRCVERIAGDRPALLWEDLLERHGPPLRFEDFHSPWPKLPSLRILRRALRWSKPLRIIYSSASGYETERWITPRAIGQYRGTVQIEAFCHSQQALRTFRLDRMLDVTSSAPPEA